MLHHILNEYYIGTLLKIKVLQKVLHSNAVEGYFVKLKCSSDLNGSLWKDLDKRVLLWHREAPLCLRVYMAYITNTYNIPIPIIGTL